MTPPLDDDDLRRLLHDAATTAWDDEVRATSAVYAGRRRLSRNRTRATLAGGLAVALVAGFGAVTLLPTGSPDVSVVLGCAAGVGTQGRGVAAGTSDGVTLSVSNPTSEVLPVTAGGTTAFAVPGTSQVTLPLGTGRSTVRCGTGSSVVVTVQPTQLAGHCTSTSSALSSAVDRGALVDLTRARLGDLPAGAVVDAVTSTSPLRHVQVRAGGAVVAEAVWHEMPGDDDWHLESLSRCS